MKKGASSSSGKCDQSGQAMTEFALVATVFMLTLTAIMFMGEVVLGYNTLCSAARLAARYASVHGSTTSNAGAIQTVAINAAPDLSLTNSNVTVSFPADTNVPSQLDAKVVINYSYSVSIPFRAPITFPLTVTSQMPVSQ
jgi:Flp pilus assembly protein TadG